MTSLTLSAPYVERDRPCTLYVATPVPTFGTARYDCLLQFLRARFPAALILEPCYLYTDAQDWLRRWPATLSALDLVVFTHDGAPNWIGKGVWREIHDAEACDIPVFFAEDDGTLHPRSAVQLTRAATIDFVRYATVTLGPNEAAS